MKLSCLDESWGRTHSDALTRGHRFKPCLVNGDVLHGLHVNSESKFAQLFREVISVHEFYRAGTIASGFLFGVASKVTRGDEQPLTCAPRKRSARARQITSILRPLFPE
jgi:hypothetical protein